jgi:hypothetical protein
MFPSCHQRQIQRLQNSSFTPTCSSDDSYKSDEDDPTLEINLNNPTSDQAFRLVEQTTTLNFRGRLMSYQQEKLNTVASTLYIYMPMASTYGS